MKTPASKTLIFPNAGVSRRGMYRQQTRPFSTPWAMNVRSFDDIEDRERGGSRPGLTKVNATDHGEITAMIPLASVDVNGNRNFSIIIIGGGVFYKLSGGTSQTIDANLLWPDGQEMLWPDGQNVTFAASVTSSSPIGDTDAYTACARGGNLFLADSVLREYNPNTGIVADVNASVGVVPTNEPLVACYRDRIVLGGQSHIVYCSRSTDPTDWDYGAEWENQAKAVAFQLEDAGCIGEIPKAIIPWNDKALVIACENSIWVLRGDPATGQVMNVSREIGIIAPEAWAMSPDGTMVFLSYDGVYIWQVASNSAPQRFSEERMPRQLRNVSKSTNRITMAYDQVGRGYHLYITPDSGDGLHWFIDLTNRAFWPVRLQDDHQPYAAARDIEGGLAETYIGCKDGYIRKFDDSAANDDGSNIESHVLIGPIRQSNNDVIDAMLAEIHGITGETSGSVTYRIVAGDSAEETVDTAKTGIDDALAGNTINGVAFSGTWTAGRNRVQRPRVRKPWFVLWISSTAEWAYEAVAIQSRILGRHRI